MANKVIMTYRELYEQLTKKYADEKGIIRGEPVTLLYRVSRAGEAAGLDSIIGKVFEEEIARLT